MVRLFDDTTQESFGIVPIDRARQLAVERELDLVEVAPMAQPPVARLMDYGRFKFEALKREKDSRKEHNIVRLKEMKLRPKISDHDFRTKFGYVKHFLQDGDKVKLTIMFRGREMVHQEFGRKLLDRMANDLKDIAVVERNPLVEGRNMIMILSPLAKKQAKGSHHEGGETERSGAARTSAAAPATEEGAPASRATVPVATESAVDGTTAEPVARTADTPPTSATSSTPRRPAAGSARRTRGSTADAEDQNT